MANQSNCSSFRAVVESSTKKNSYESGKEIGEKILEKMSDKSPNLILLFCTIDYKDYGGLEKILDGIYSIINKETKLAGGTVPGFINQKGCYASGVTALAIYHEHMNISIGTGKNTKRNPKKAAKKAINQIKSNLTNQYENKIIFSIISGPKNPNLPGVKNKNIINSKIKSRIVLSMFSFMQKVFQKGFGRERELIEEIIRELPDFYLIHTTSYSKPPYNENYQFHNKKVLDEQAVIVAIETDIKFNLNFATGAEKTDKKLNLTSLNKGKTVIKKINRKPPLEEYIKKMGLTNQEFEEMKWTYINTKHPFGYIKNNKTILRPPLLILGNYMGLLTKIEEEKNIFIADITPEKMISATDEVLTIEKPLFGFFTSCIARRDLLGIKVFKIQEKMKDYFKDRNFLLVYSASEGLYKPDDDFYFLNETITSAIFREKS